MSNLQLGSKLKGPFATWHDTGIKIPLITQFLHHSIIFPSLFLGEIKASSGNVDLQRFLEQQLRIEGQSLSYPNLIEGLIRNPGNVQTLEDLSTENSAVIGMEFATLRDFFPSIEVSY